MIWWQNIKARRREELLSKRQKAEEERKMFVKEMAEKKAAERKEVVKQARKLLLQKKPLCRQINRALLTSEVLSHEMKYSRNSARVRRWLNLKLSTVISSVLQRAQRPSGASEDYSCDG